MMFSSILPKSPAAIREEVLTALEREEQRVNGATLKLREQINDARDRAQFLRASCEEAYGTVQRLEAEARALGHQLEVKRSEFERTARECADPRLRQFDDWCDAELDRLKHQVRYLEGRTAPNMKGDRHEIRSSNLPAIQLMTEAIVAARSRARELTYQRVADLPAALEEIRRSIPTLDDAERQTQAA